MTRWLGLLALLSAGASFSQTLEVSADWNWSDVVVTGNRTTAYGYRSLPDDSYFRSIGLHAKDRGLQFGLVWHTPLEGDHSGRFRALFAPEGHWLRASWDRSRYFADPTTTLSTASQTEVREIAARLEPSQGGACLGIRATDRWVGQPDIVRLRPTAGYDYRSITYDTFGTAPVRTGLFRADLLAIGLDDRTGRAPSGWSRAFSVEAERSLVSNGVARLSFRELRTEQEGLAASTVRRWTGSVSYLPAEAWYLRLSGSIARTALPNTATRHASNHDRLGLLARWRPRPTTSVAGSYEYRTWLSRQDGMPFSERSASHRFGAVARHMDPRLGALRLSFEHGYLLHPPITTIPSLVSSASLYPDRWQAIHASWLLDVYPSVSVHTEARWNERTLSERGAKLRRLHVSSGVAFVFAEQLTGFLDFGWEAFDWSLADDDPEGLNDGNNGDLEPGLASRPYTSRCGVITSGFCWDVGPKTRVDATASLRRDFGGPKSAYFAYSLGLEHYLTEHAVLAISYGRESFRDHFVDLYDHDLHVLTLSFRTTMQRSARGNER